MPLEEQPKKCPKKCKKSKSGRGSVPKIKKSTMQNVDFFELRGEGPNVLVPKYK